MIVALLILAGAIVLWWDLVVEHLRRAAESPALRHLEVRHLLGIAMLAAAVAAWSWQSPKAPIPPPAPRPEGGLSLAGLFTGPTAAEDAAMLAALCGSLADCVELDAGRETPRLTSGAAIDELRVVAREGRTGGVSIGDRQPLVRDAIRDYMTRPDVLGPSGGPIDDAQRRRWVAAFRAVSAAAEAVIR